MRFFTQRFAQMTKGGIAGLIAVVVVAGVVLFFWGARALNTTPHQCTTCHPVLTAMWKRSQSHPAERVTCHECHAQHAELPDSLNVAAYVRDRLIPEKYFSFEERVEARCEACHAKIPTAGTGVRMVAVKNALRSGLAATVAFEADRGETLDLTLLGNAWGPGESELGTAEFLGAAAKALRDWEVRRALARAKPEGGSESQTAGDLMASLRATVEGSEQAMRELERLASGEENDKVGQKYLDAARVLAHAVKQHRSGMELLEQVARGLQGDPVEVRVVAAAIRSRPAEAPATPEGAEPDRPPEPRAVLQSSEKALQQVKEATGSLRRIIKKKELTELQGLFEDLAEAGTEASRRLGEVLQAYEELEGEISGLQKARRALYDAHLLAPEAEAEDGRAIALTVTVGAQSAPNRALRLKEFLEALLEPLDEIEQGMAKKKIIRLNHKAHVSSQTDLGGNPLAMGCLDCHRNIAHDKAQVETYRPTMAGCFVGDCHRKDRNKDNCRRCHYQHLTEPGQEIL